MTSTNLASTSKAQTTAQAARQLIRRGEWTSHTSGLADGHAQGNVVILPEALASNFLRYCQLNPKPCPLLAVGEPGQAHLPSLGDDIDIRTDVPSYRVWSDGVLVDEPNDIRALWRKDLVTFIIGCSFSFEEALLQAGLPLRHISQKRNVAMYRSNIATAPAGPFNGPMANEIPVFWACGVTPQAAITQARPEFCITHAPGAMLITDLLNHQLATP